ncbi:hypothetical protein [Engelhardtia mirabilis]|uniref:Uncharacterized protein n=1 Tax=Engelhardtia mirabilis TaxID=2528011 RepID=A0A518BSP3_9BACT|nr:hypothetical protein Pla133_51160 [Planctomycetes bacterium Pla133]QDV04318.1 hypothetical protein Pla86_51130 [Planctomycetes bacterium Pla86]
MELSSERGRARLDTPVFLVALRRAFVRPMAWVFSSIGVCALALVVTLPTHAWVADTVATRYAPGSQAFNMDATFRTDQAQGLSQLYDSLATTAGWLALVAVFFGVFTAGGWLGTLLDPSRTSVTRRYFHGGVRYFWRFVRLSLLFLVLTDIAGRLFLGDTWRQVVLEGWMGWPGGDSEFATSELTVRRLVWLQDGLYALTLSGLWTWATYTRVRIALQSQSSVVFGSLRALGTILRHPIQTLRPMALLFVVDFAFLLGCGAIAGPLLQEGLRESASLWRVLALLGLTVTTVVVRQIFDGARYAAALAVSSRVVRPKRADPWKERIGGPGGPQYPISDEDEFQISM